MQATKEPNLSDILLSVSDVKNQVTILSKRLDLISPTKSSYEHSPLGTRAFERAMENLDIDSDEVQELPKRNPRRSTIYENSMKFQEPLVNESNIQMLYTPVQSDLLLTHLTVSAVLFFMDKFRVLQQKQRNIPLLLGDFLHLNVSEELVAREIEQNDVDYSDKVIGNILRLPNVIVYGMIVRAITPRNKEILMQQLNKNLKFPHLPDGYVVSASFYQPMSKALIEFKGKFLTLYDLLTTFIDYPLPPLRTKGLKKGILSCFIDLIPQNHGVKLLQSMNYDQLKLMTDIKKDFFPVFFSIVRNITKQSNIIKDLNHTMEMQFTNQYKKEYSDSKKQSSTPTPFKNLSNITESTIPTYESDNEDITMNNTNLFYQHIASMKNEENEQSESSVEDPHDLSNLAITKEKTILPCYTMLRSGKCVKGTECKYSHIKTELIKGWQDMFTELKASPFNPNKHLTQANTKNTFHTPSKTLQSIVEDVITPDISEKS
jgi:hypothetical protein